MSVDVLFFASLRDATGTDKVSLEIDEPLSLEAFLPRLRSLVGAGGIAALTAENVRIAINQEMIRGPVTVQDGDEVAFMPPVTGG
jgi:molybdopterin synthase sulfur carrier subunit